MKQRDVLPEHIARSVLARATELDARAPVISTDELRAIAAELNVSPTSLDTALQEHHEATQRESARQRGAFRVAALGLPIGAVAGSLLSTASDFTAPSIWFLATAGGLLSSTALIVLQSRRPSIPSYVLQNTILWGGVAVGALSAIAAIGTGSASLVQWGVSLLDYGLKHWLTSTILGAAAVTAILRADSARRPRLEVPSLPSHPTTATRLGDGTRRALEWIKTTLRFRTRHDEPHRASGPAGTRPWRACITERCSRRADISAAVQLDKVR